MKTISQLIDTAKSFRDATVWKFITATKLGQLLIDILDYLSIVDKNSNSMSVRKTYATAADMTADTTPVYTVSGVEFALKFGQYVAVTNDTTNNGLYRFISPGWEKISSLGDIVGVSQELGTSTTSVISQDAATKAFATKADHGYEEGETVKTLKAVEDELDQLAGDIVRVETDLNITNGTNIYLTNIKGDYNACVQELYINPLYLNDTYYLRSKSHNGTFYVRPYNSETGYTMMWNAEVRSVISKINGFVYPIICTIAGNGVNLNDVVGYVVFKNKDLLSSFTDTGLGESINKTYVNKISNSVLVQRYIYPIELPDNSIESIKIKNNSIESIKIKNGAITSQNIKGRVVFTERNKYSDYIGELWINPIYRDVTTQGIKYYMKIYNNTLFVRPYINGVAPYIWNCAVVLPSQIGYNMEPIKIIVTHPGGGLNLGDEIGYITFIDPSIFSDSDDSLGYMLSDNIWHIGNFPIIYQFVNSGNLTTMEDGVEVVLPSEITVPVGDNLEVFYRPSIRCINPYSYDIVSICSVGKNYPRYFQFKPEATHAGNTYSLRIDVKRNDTTIVATKTTTIRVIPSISSPEIQKNILVFGASATADGNYAYECQRRLTTNTGDGTPYNPTGLNLGNIAFVGRKTGTAKNVKLEATGGWSWADFAGQGRPAYRFNVTGITLLNIGDTYSVNGVVLTITEVNITDGSGNIRCTYVGGDTISASGTLTRITGTGDATITYTSIESESYNPFWNDNTEKLDFINYANLYCNGSIDVIVAHCGVNDIFVGRTGKTLVDTYVKPFARAFHADFPNSKFIISSLPIPDCTGGMGANYGASLFNYYNRSQGFWDTAKAFDVMANDAEFSNWLSIAPVVQLFDNENGYPKSATPVNNRSTVTELLGTNGVHPTEYGSYMVADAIYNTLLDVL